MSAEFVPAESTAPAGEPATILLAQADEAPAELKRRRKQDQEAGGERQPKAEKRAPKAEAPEPKQRRQQAAEPAPQREPQAAAEKPAAPERKQQAAPEPAAAEAEPRKAREERKNRKQPAAETAAQPDEAPRQKKGRDKAAEPDAKAAASQEKPAKQRKKPAEAENSAAKPEARPANEPVPEEKPGKSAPDAPVPAAAPSKDDARQKRRDQQAGEDRRPSKDAAGDSAGDRGQAAEAPAKPKRQEPSGADANAGDARQQDGQKPQRADQRGEPGRRPEGKPEPVPAATQNQKVDPGRINASDARVQKLQEPVKVTPITEEKGERIEGRDRGDRRGDRRADRDRRDSGDRDRDGRDRRPEDRFDGRLPDNVKVVKRDDDGRQILSIIGAAAAGAVAGGAAAYFIKGDDHDRLSRNAQDTYYERLPRGRTRQTIVRENGVQVVTITNSYGDIVRRSRIMPDGREVVLFYDPYSEDDRRPTYELDPGRDLPPLRVDIPRDEYVVDVDRPDEDLYYRTLVAPPVETVSRIYSVDEVVRSERIRDKVRRIDLNTINFDTGSAEIGRDQADTLEALADAIKEVVDKNPAETFLIEGHTDAVGSEISNLDLSDRRAESVASALTQYFDVPPENLVTQGYGESDLKVDTQSANAENRRVTVRRITALVKPVETSQN
ncbi:hypothetical protein E3C22_07850 [Jiella endophytica]|uniref:OmpA-like domain-containing protein n=2 Tax=Jiella endophytica TaxID=2558362 RepID=A0A4Y8RQR0_9HYPH|nr:hypothetical protein E3C22_07850 [Jiella endophytica]